MFMVAEPDLTREEMDELLATLRKSPIGQQLLDEGQQQGIERGIEQGIEQGIAQGIEQGIGLVERQFQRRLGRLVTAEEHRTLVRRLGTLGPARVGDVVLDLSSDALAAWLADPNAT